MKKKVLLVITDGIGYAKENKWNAFYHAKKPNYDWLFSNVPYSFLSTFGRDVGLPDGQMGNSEVGHMCIGAGRVLYQDLVKISNSIDDSSLSRNPVLLDFVSNLNVVHLCGLLSDGGVHSHIDHLIGLIKILESFKKEIRIHIITDGRDVPPKSAKKYINQILNMQNDRVKISTICGRFYAMDRDNRWDRTLKALDSIKNGGPKHSDPLKYIDSQYEIGISDEFILPCSFNNYNGFSKDEKEGLIFTNFRSDRARQIIRALNSPFILDSNKDSNEALNLDSNEGVRVDSNERIKILTMCEYDETFSFPILFPKENVSNCLSQIISENNLKQFHIAESEKYAHVTFFFNGGREEPFLNEDRVLIPSPKIKTYDLKPSMSAKEICDRTLESMKEDYDFILVNFANGDMVGHTGDFEASIKAVEAVDFELGRLIEGAKKDGYSFIITSDHGNCEKMKDENGNPLTNHTAGYVWCFVYDNLVKKVNDGNLSNVASSVLKLLNLKVPEFMNPPLF